MRRLLLIAATTALLVGCCVGVASAGLSGAGAERDAPEAAPFRTPAAAPRADGAQPNAWGYRSSAAIGRDVSGGAASTGRPTDGASIVVTATVLPVVTIVVDPKTGRVTELVTNTPDRDPAEVLYVVRMQHAGGEAGELTAATWVAARAALARAHAGTGTIWSA